MNIPRTSARPTPGIPSGSLVLESRANSSTPRESKATRGWAKHLAAKSMQRNAHGYSGKGSEQRGARSCLSDSLGYKRSCEFNNSGEKASRDPDAPGHKRGFLRGDSSAFGRQFRRDHHQEDEGEQGNRVYPVGKRRYVFSSGGCRESLCEPGVVEVADNKRYRYGREDRGDDKLSLQTHKTGEQYHDQNILDEIVHHEAEKAFCVGERKKRLCPRGKKRFLMSYSGVAWNRRTKRRTCDQLQL